MDKKWIILPITALLMSCGGGEKENQQLHSVMTVQAGDVSSMNQKVFSGIVKENAEIGLGFKTAGQIEKIYVKEGDHISKGQLLATLDSKDYQLSVDGSEAKYKQMKDELARKKKLLDGHSLSANDYEKAENDLKQVEVQLQGNRNKVKYTKLYAPTSGIVQSVNFEPAEMVNSGTAVFNIISQGQMKVEVNVPLEVYQNRAKIKSISCNLDGRNIPVSLLSITPKADASQLYKVLLAVGNASGISSGMNVSVVFNMATGTQNGTMTLPEGAVFQDKGKNYVWVVGSDSTVTKREIMLGGIDADGKMIISSGLSGNEEVVKAGVHSLVDKEKVKILPKQSKTNVGGLL